ncbi:MAG: tetratricopeptide repeat protein [bacterium]|nr:tetratricopeptide repeat protein [bacterium]
MARKICPALILCLLMISCQSMPMPRLLRPQDSLTAEEHNDLGVVYEEKQQRTLARKEYLKAVEKKPDWAVPYFNLANLSYKEKDRPASERYYKKALELRPDYPDCLNNLAWLCCEQKRYDEALQYINKALALSRKQEYIDTQKKIQAEMK